MGRKKGILPATNTLHDITSFEDLDTQMKQIALRKSLLIQDHLNSTDVDKILKATSYLERSKSTTNDSNLKTMLFSPDNEFNNGLGYKSNTKSVTFDMLRKMGKTPVINAVISTRIDQIKRFAHFSIDDQKEGWTIRRKLSPFVSTTYKMTDKDKQRIEQIADFVNQCGINNKWDITDDFEEFLGKFMRDSLEMDAATFEIERNRRFEPVSFMAQDSGMIRLLETVDPKSTIQHNYTPKFGYLPIYCQTYNNQILIDPLTQEEIVYYPWELCYGIRNKQTNIRNNGYGLSELEILMEIITWLLWGMQYNGNFFKNGSNPKGFFTIDGNVDQTMLNEFRSAWRDMVVGVQGAHKIPVFEGDKVTWNNMQLGNKDMEHARWIELLTVIACSVYKIDPSEIGFRLEFQGDSFGQKGQKERLDHSKDKGLKPLMVFAAKHINKYVVSELDPGFEFVWTGLDLEDETQILDNDLKKLNGGLLSLEDGFKKYNDRALDKEKDTILNPIYQQIKASAMFGGQSSNEAVDAMENKGLDMIDTEVAKYINKAFGNEQ